MLYCALAYYLIEPLQNPKLEVKRHKDFLKNKEVTGRIYLSEQGINGQASGTFQDAQAFMQWLQKDYPQIKFKIHPTHENIFPRLTIKYRKQLVAVDFDCDLTNRGEYLTPQQWREALESKESFILLDVRNDYEWKIGHFEGSELPPLEKFRDFPAYADQLPKDKKILMCCTGGIRCEIYSAVLKAKGIQSVYQLEGGIINYGLQEGNAHWKGRLFVFDDRLAVSIDDKPAEPIANCCVCNVACDTYYNCANMDCNNLFIACPACIQQQQGCCSNECLSAPRVRPYLREGGNKPFRRKHLIG